VGEKVSVFSPRCGYSVRYHDGPRRPPPDAALNLREFLALSFLRACRVMAGFQLAWLWSGSKGKNALAALARWGVIWRHRFEGVGRLNVYTLPGIYPEVGRALRELVLAQLYVRVRRFYPAELLPAEPPFQGVISFAGLSFPVLVLRHGDPPGLPALLGPALERALVLAEEWHPEFSKVAADARFVLDGDLLWGPLSGAFRFPDGTPDFVPLLAEEGVDSGAGAC
jgi:hypothetical protein